MRVISFFSNVVSAIGTFMNKRVWRSIDMWFTSNRYFCRVKGITSMLLKCTTLNFSLEFFKFTKLWTSQTEWTGFFWTHNNEVKERKNLVSTLWSSESFIVTDDFGGFDTRFEPRTHSWMRKKVFRKCSIGHWTENTNDRQSRENFWPHFIFCLSTLYKINATFAVWFEPVARFLLYLVLCMQNSFEFFLVRLCVISTGAPSNSWCWTF